MKIRFEYTDHEESKGDYVECKIPDDSDFNDLMRAIKGLCVALGYTPETVEGYFGEE